MRKVHQQVAALAVFLFLVCAVSPSALADTLELKDGRMLSGKYLGGTSTSVRFQSDGRIRLHRVSDVLAVTFGGSAAYAPPAAGPSSSTYPPASSGYPASSVTPSSTATAGVTIPAGTRIKVRMIDSINSETNKVGDRFHASLAEDLLVDGRVVARRGADAYGRLVHTRDAGAITGRSELTLELTELHINGRSHSLSSGNYEVAGQSRSTESAQRIGGAAAIGAAIGAIAGGGKGAAIGAGVGAGAGTAIQVLTRGEHVRVPSETVVEFRLQEPVTISTARSVR